MIKINIRTQELSRESIPANLKGLSAHTLNNLQTALNPVPQNLTDIEYWRESPQATVFDEYTQRLGAEILTVDASKRVVNVTNEVVALTAQEIEATLNAVKSAAKERVTAKRYEVETSGVTLGNGIVVGTDKLSQAMVSSAFNHLGNNPTKTLDWKSVGGWVTIDKAQLDAIADAVGNHVQAAFSNEKAHHEAVDLLTTHQAIIDYDITTGWPS